MISDHALIRYLERKKGFCFDDIRKEMLTPRVVNAINCGAVAVKANGITYRIKDKVIVTVVKEKK